MKEGMMRRMAQRFLVGLTALSLALAGPASAQSKKRSGRQTQSQAARRSQSPSRTPIPLPPDALDSLLLTGQREPEQLDAPPQQSGPARPSAQPPRQFDRSAYEPASFAEIARHHQPSAIPPKYEHQLLAGLHKFSTVGRWTGKSRPLTANARSVIEEAIKVARLDPTFINLMTEEHQFTQDGQPVWCPVQRTIAETLRAEAKVGDEVRLLCAWLGAWFDQAKRPQHVYVVNSWEAQITPAAQRRVANFSSGKPGTASYQSFSFWVTDGRRAQIVCNYGPDYAEVELTWAGSAVLNGSRYFKVQFPGGQMYHVIPQGLSLKVVGAKRQDARLFKWEYTGPVNGIGTFCEPCADERESMDIIKKYFLK
jgi:hypothetical protein